MILLDLCLGDKLQDTYAGTDCLVFPSRIETWGLPISEFLPYNRPMLLSDLPFAHETAAGASAVGFFDPSSSVALADAMERVLRGDHTQLHSVPQRPLQAPTCTPRGTSSLSFSCLMMRLHSQIALPSLLLRHKIL